MMSLINELQKILASNYTLYTKYQNFHWNVTGPHFYSLHNFFEEQYTALAEANDEIAERIRALGSVAPGTMQAFIELSLIKESPEALSAEQMLETLKSDNEIIIEQLKKLIVEFAESGDDGTADLLTQRVQYHQKTLWMLESTLA